MHGRNGNPPEESQDVPTSMEENTNYTSSSPSSTDDIENNQPEPNPANEESYGEVLDMHGKHEETSDNNSDVHLSSRTSDKSASDTIEDVPSRILTESSGLFTNAHQFKIHGSSFADHSTRTQINAGNGYFLAAVAIIASIYNTAYENFKPKCILQRQVITIKSHYRFHIDSNDAGISLRFVRSEKQSITYHATGRGCKTTIDLYTNTDELQALSFALYTRHMKNLTSAKSLALWGMIFYFAIIRLMSL
ncbi:hypothetical protein BDQ17DRAFT_1374313 [Cyathus striatus]|nr:hypothetical protein BDQ17DRAFT_1374313 [Cyathus striatus]